MFVFYDANDIGRAVAVYSCRHDSRTWDEYDSIEIPGAKLVPGVALSHHKVVSRPNPKYTASRAADPGVPYGGGNNEEIPKDVLRLEEMSQTEKDAHPLAQPDQPSPTPNEIEVPR